MRITDASIVDDGIYADLAIAGLAAGPVPQQINVTFEDGSTIEGLIRFYPDEVTFTADEIVGLTADQARELHRKKDIEWLQAP
jgi:hypothetical protein